MADVATSALFARQISPSTEPRGKVRRLRECRVIQVLSNQRDRIGAREALMPVLLRSATEADVKRVESLLAELGYPSKEGDVRHRLRRSLHSDTSCVLLAQSASEVIGLVSAESLFSKRLDDLQSYWSRRLDASSWLGGRWKTSYRRRRLR